MSTDTSAPAYPRTRGSTDDDYDQGYTGFTMRQAYALAAMKSLITAELSLSNISLRASNLEDASMKVIAKKSFQMADAMLEADGSVL